VRLGDLTDEEIGEAAAGGWLAVVPTGCTEQQGPHLPVDFDAWLVEQLCVAAAEMAVVRYDVCSLVMPTLPFGPTHRRLRARWSSLALARWRAGHGVGALVCRERWPMRLAHARRSPAA